MVAARMITLLALIASFMTRPQLRVARQRSLRPSVACADDRQARGRQKAAAAEMPPLNVQRYGRGACLHVAPTGVRRVCRTTELPGQPKRSVRLVIISDTHSQLDAVTIPAGDILCHTGDITFCARGGRTALADFNEQLRSLPHQHKLVIAGNHDKRIEQLGAEQVRRVITAAHYLENNGVRLCGLEFWGCPYSPYKRKSSNTAFQYNDEKQRAVMGRIPADIDVLLTHGIKGSAHLRKALERVRPSLHAHGHDHDEHGATVRLQKRGGDAAADSTAAAPPQRPPQKQQRGGAMRVRSIRVNAAICNRFYKPVQLPVVVDLVVSSKPKPKPKPKPPAASAKPAAANANANANANATRLERRRSSNAKTNANAARPEKRERQGHTGGARPAGKNATHGLERGHGPRNGARAGGKNATRLGATPAARPTARPVARPVAKRGPLMAPSSSHVVPAKRPPGEHRGRQRKRSAKEAEEAAMWDAVKS